MINQGKFEYYRESPECKSKDNLLKDKKPKVNEDQIYSMIDGRTENLINSFMIVANSLKEQMKNFVSSNIVSVMEQEMMNYEDQVQRVLEKVDQVFKELNEKVQAMTKVDLSLKSYYNWSTTNKHADTQIYETTVTTLTGNWNINLLEPSFTMADVTKVKLKVNKLTKLVLLLCDVNIARDRGPTWDYRQNVGTYSHYNTGKIYSHHQAIKQSSGWGIAFKFQEGDILELEWNGPKKQFITSRPSTKDKYVHNVQFNGNAVLNFGVQIAESVVQIIQ